MISRILLAAVWLFAGIGVAQADVLTEAEVIRLARAQDPDAARARAAIAVAAAREVEAGLRPNPVLAWDREGYLASGAGPGESDDVLSLSVPIEFSGRRSARRALARAEVADASAGAARSQSDAVVNALAAFYEALAAERRVAIARGSMARLEEAARVLGRRHEAGMVSGYERDRLELEAELARSELREAESRAVALRWELDLVLGLEATVKHEEFVLEGTLALAPEGLAETPDQAMSRPSIEFARSAVVAAQAAGDGARRAWLPSLSLSGGLRVGSGEDTRYGYVAGIAVSLPVFSHGQELRAEAQAKERLLQARVRVAEQAARIEAGRALARLTLASEELARFEEATVTRVERLERAVESGYREGQRSVVELVDAQRTRATVERRRLALALMAKRAQIALRASRGEFE